MTAATACARIGLVALAGLAAITLPAGCAKRYVVNDPEIDAKVIVEATYDAEAGVLKTKADADVFRIYGVALRDADDEIHTPIVATRGPSERRGGVNLGIGLGVGIPIGSVSVGPGIGVGAPIGGRIVPGPVNAQFNKPPDALQPWTLNVVLDVDPARLVRVPLGKVKKTDPLAADHDYGPHAVRIETWTLVDDTTRRFAVHERDDGATIYREIEKPAQPR